MNNHGGTHKTFQKTVLEVLYFRCLCFRFHSPNIVLPMVSFILFLRRTGIHSVQIVLHFQQHREPCKQCESLLINAANDRMRH